ncbi:MAG: prepilin peptidase [Terriglobales bacterium]
MAATWLIIVFGLVAGSFLGLCADRLPQGQSVVRPGSRCPHCERPLEAWENVPVAAFAWLRGRCRSCRKAIGWPEPAIEIAAAAAFYWSWRRSGGGIEFVREAFFLGCLITLAVTDWRTRQLPDEITLGGWVTGLVLAVWSGPGLETALAGSVVGAGGLALVGWIYYRLRGRMGLGWGDVKMLGLLGAFLGLGGMLAALLVGCVSGAIVGVAQSGRVLALQRQRGRSWARARATAALWPLPFGVFLALGGAVALAWGPWLWRAWLG